MLYIKISENTDLSYYKKTQYVVLNKAKYHYKNNNVRLRGQARDKYRNLSEEEKNKTREYGKNIYYNMSEEKKTECQKKIIAWQKSLNIIMDKMVFN